MNLLAQEMGAFIIKKIIMNKTMTYIASLLLCIGSVSCGNNTKTTISEYGRRTSNRIYRNGSRFSSRKR